LGVFVQERYIGKVRRFLSSPLANEVFADPNASAVFYTDVTGRWRFGTDSRFELYGTVNNAFDRQPPAMAQVLNPGIAVPTFTGGGAATAYDIVGRYFTLGVKAEF
jgi:hypothetical protein